MSCPRPDKHPYESRSAAVGVLRWRPARKRKGLRIYKCRRGRWHFERQLRRSTVAWKAAP